MPYRKTYRRKNRRYRRRPVRQVARYEARKAIMRAIETKMYDSTYSTSVDNTTGVVYSLFYDPSAATTIQQGVNDNNYIGQKIKPTHIQIKWQSTVADSANLLRILVVQTKGLFTPTLAQLLQNNGTIQTPLSSYNQDNDSKFIVLASRLVCMDAYNTTRCGILNIKSKKVRPVIFANSTGGVESANIFLALVSDSGAVSHPTFTYYCRVSFKDA